MEIPSFVLLTLSLGLAHELSADVLYSVNDLGTLGGGLAVGRDLNNAGQVTGVSDGHAFLYSNGVMTDLGTLGGSGTGSFGFGINNVGQVTGQSTTSTGYSHAFLYSNGVMADLGTLGGPNSYGRAINNNEQVVGYSDTATGTHHAFLYSNGFMTDLGALGYGFTSDINDAGQVTGQSDGHAFLYSNGQIINLGTLGGSVSYAAAVNNAGQVAGTSYTSTGGTHAFLYHDNHLIDLGTLGSGIFSNGEAINEAGQVVGGSTVFGSFVYHAFVYSSGQMTDLNALIDQKLDLTLDYAEAINDSGQIVATGRVAASGGTHTFLLTPIPEPSTLTLFGLPTLLLLGAVTLSHTKSKSRNK